MSPIEVVVPPPDGDCPATLHLPDGGAAPAVIMYPDAAGVRETFRLMADRLAAADLVVLLPGVSYRQGTWQPFDAATVFGDPDERARLMGMSRSVSAEMTVRDAGAFLDFLGGRPPGAGRLGGAPGHRS